VPVLRKFVACSLLVVWPLALSAQDKPSAILHSEGSVWVNGAEVVGTSPIFPGDLIETRPKSVANLDTEGSSVLVQPESILKFQGTFLDLDHGGVSVGTSTGMSVQVKCLKVDPVSNERTQYDVVDRSGVVHVSAHKQDVTITRSSLASKTAQASKLPESATVHEGEEAQREESTACGGPTSPENAGTGLNTKWLEVGGAIGGVAILCILLCRGSSPSSPPVSPWQP
jgi:hypothetical protein